MSLFGTDGIRGIPNFDLSFDLVYKVGRALCYGKKPLIILGCDNRQSSDIICSFLISGVLSNGGNVKFVGVVPSACVAFLTKHFKADFGVVITASHNPKEYNGIKIFNSFGEKISVETEKEIQSNLDINKNVNDFGKLECDFNAKYIYEKYIVELFNDMNIPYKICVDTANGASCKIAKNIFNKLNINATFLNNSFDGNKINESAGCLNIDNFKSFVKKNKFDFGVAFDGDADRLVLVDKEGFAYNGERLMYMFVLNELNKGNKIDSVCGNIYLNSALVRMFTKLNVNVTRCNVGDKFLIEHINNFKSSFGAEASGHIIIPKLESTGDGILSALYVLSIIKNNPKLLKLARYKEDFSIMKNIKCNTALLNFDNLNSKIEAFDDVRVIIRRSGTEDLIRLFVEGKKKKRALEIASEIEKIIFKLNEECICVE